MSSFASQLTNQTTTTNGAAAYKSTQSAVLDLFSSGVSSTHQETLITSALAEDPILAIKVCLYLRDVRQGQGNRNILRSLFKVLKSLNSLDYMNQIIPHLPEIGRWKDVVELIDPTTQNEINSTVGKLIAEHLAEDRLLAKWLPRQGPIAKFLVEGLNITHGDYRRHIASLSSTTEQQMCSKQWSEINYSAVPSIANKKYAKAFLRNDSSRRQQFLDSAVKGEVKINSSVLYPHQIIRALRSEKATANALWAQLPNYMENAVNVLPIIDTSGSMSDNAVGTEGTCLDIAVGLGLYFAEHNTGSYKDLWMNFSTNPQAYYLRGDTLAERVKNLDYNNWHTSTDINKAMDFVLTAAVKAPEDTPKMILIVSDMEFNSCTSYGQTNFEYMRQQFQKLGVEMPTIVFWRVNVKSGSTPITKSDKNTIILNGYSPSVLKYILSGDVSTFDPYTAMCDIVSPMYTWLK